MVRPSDIEVYITRHTTFKHLSRRDAVKQIAALQGKTRGGVSGALSRATGTLDARQEAKQALIHHMARNVPESTPATRGIDRLVQNSTQQHNERLQALPDNKLIRCAFISDIHFPAHDPAALDLTYKILDDYQPHIVSAGNDDLDFAAISHWQDRRSLTERAIDADISHSVEIAALHYELVSDIVPGVIPVYIGANHNKRVASYSGKNDSVATVNNTLMQSVMQRLHNAGVLFLNDMGVENLYFLNDHLAWFHGQSASSNSKTCLKNNYRNARRLVRQMRIEPREFSLVYGHTHRMSVERYDKIIELFGYNSGCLCKMDMDYLKHGNDWQHGITLSDVDRNGTYHDTQLIEYRHDFKRGKLIARVNGKTYSVDKD